jgi:hypothetical protein
VEQAATVSDQVRSDEQLRRAGRVRIASDSIIGGYSPSDIAGTLGISGTSRYGGIDQCARAFNARFGMTMSAYRAAAKHQKTGRTVHQSVDSAP